MSRFLSAEFLGNSALQWITALVVSLAGSFALAGMIRLAGARLTAWSSRSDGTLDDAVADMVRGTQVWFIVAVALLLGAETLTLSARLTALGNRIFIIAVVVQTGFWLHAGIGGWLRGYLDRGRSADATRVTTTVILGFIARLVLWSLVLLLVIENFGVDITALVASLGIGGIAVALALQNILGDVFASLAIALDQPVVIGDFIVLGDVMGAVERIGLKTTHLRSLSGELIVLSNADLLKSRIHNYRRMFERRVLFGFGVTYGTPPEKLREVPALVTELVRREPLARFDRAHLSALGASALEFEVVYYVKDPDYTKYMDVQQRINLGLIEALRDRGVEFAYPTQTIHVATLAGQHS